MTLVDLDIRLQRVELRLGDVEQSLRKGGFLNPPTDELQQAVVAEPLPVVPLAAGPDLQPKASHVIPQPPPFEVAPVAAAPSLPRFSAPPPFPTSLNRKAELLQYPRAEKPKPVAQSDFEKTVGLKWAGWIGALVFVIGAVLGVKFAYDQGWFNNLIPNWLWLSLIAFAGFALIATGEWVYRKINQISAAGLYAAGVATLFVASYSGHAYYEIYSQSVAFTCMGLSALIGAAVAIRGNMVSIGVISLLGANIAPMLLGNRNAPVASFLAYLFATQIVALVLAGRGKGGKWWTLRGLSLGMVSFWMIAILNRHQHESVVWVFTLVFAGVYQAELILTNLLDDRRGQSHREGTAGLVFSTFVTAALTVAMLWIHADDSNLVRTAWVMGIAAVCGGLGLILSSPKRPALTDLATGYALQAMALAFVAVPVYTSGPSIEIGWAALAICIAVIGIVTEKSVPRGVAIIAWGLAVGHLLIRNGAETTRTVFVTVDSIPLHTNAVLALSLAIVGQVIAILTNIRQPKASLKDAATMLSIAATLVFVVTSVIELPMSYATFAVVVFAWLLIGIAKFLPNGVGNKQGAALLIVAAAKWLVVDALVPAFNPSSTRVPVIFNAMNLTALILIASASFCILSISKIAATEKSKHDLRIALRLAIAMIALVDLSVEISRWFDQSAGTLVSDPRLAKQVALSIFWACFAVGAVILGFTIREASLRYFGLVLLAITLMKVVTVDLSGISQGYRILSFIGVGLLMLGTSVVYGKVSPKLLASDSPESTGG